MNSQTNLLSISNLTASQCETGYLAHLVRMHGLHLNLLSSPDYFVELKVFADVQSVASSRHLNTFDRMSSSYICLVEHATSAHAYAVFEQFQQCDFPWFQQTLHLSLLVGAQAEEPRLGPLINQVRTASSQFEEPRPIISDYESDSVSSTPLTSLFSSSSRSNSFATTNSEDEHMYDQNECTLFVGGLPFDMGHSQLENLFRSFGSLTYVRIVPRQRCGFVSFQRRLDAETAMQTMQRFPLEHGRHHLRLEWASSGFTKHQQNISKLSTALAVPYLDAVDILETSDRVKVKRMASFIAPPTATQIRGRPSPQLHKATSFPLILRPPYHY